MGKTTNLNWWSPDFSHQQYHQILETDGTNNFLPARGGDFANFPANILPVNRAPAENGG